MEIENKYVQIVLFYEGKDITASIVPSLLSFSYTDKSEGESDSLEINLEDIDDLWRGAWLPDKGSRLVAEIRDGENVLKCGTFEIDEVEYSGSVDGDIVTIKALGAGIRTNAARSGKRTKRSYAHEEKTLFAIASTIATKSGLTIVGTVPNIKLGRETQYRETDLAFLHRIGLKYGIIFNIRGSQLIFTESRKIEGATAAFTLSKKSDQLLTWAIRDKLTDIYKAVSVRCANGKKKKIIQHYEEVDDISVETLEVRSRVENQQQAETVAKSALYRANSENVELNASVIGNVAAVTGNNLELTDFKAYDGTFYLTESTHTVDRDMAYVTSFVAKRVNINAGNKQLLPK